MNRELKELLNQINEKKEDIRSFINKNKVDEAKSETNVLKKMQDKFNILFELEDEKEDNIKNYKQGNIINKKYDTNKINESFINVLKAKALKIPVLSEDIEILNSMSEGSDADGGLTVPQDIRTKIKEFRRSDDALETLVNVESVKTLSGSRVIEKLADQTPFDNVDEAAEFPEISTPKFEKIEYKVKKKGGILRVTRELLEDSSENIQRYLRKWISKKAKATRNFMIVKMINEITNGKEKPITSIDDLKDIFNIVLDPSIATTSKILTNQSSFNWLDKLKDNDGNYILQCNPIQPTQKILFGRYQVFVVSNKVLPSSKNGAVEKYPIICGDLKEAITIFDRETLSVLMSTEASDLWEKDLTGIKVRERLDIQPIDKNAIIKAEVLSNAT